MNRGVFGPFLISTFFLAALGACDSDPTIPAGPIAATVHLTTPDTLPIAGNSVPLEVSVLDADGVELENPVISWETSDPNRGTVDEMGVVTIVGTGPVTITARSGEASGAITIRGVRGLSISSVNLSPAAQPIGTTRQLIVEARDSANQVIQEPQVVFISSDPNIVSIDDEGTMRALKLGRASITVRIENQFHFIPMEVITGYDVATEIGTLGGDSSRAFGVNDHGYVVGDAQTATGEWHAFVFREGILTDVGPSGMRSRAIAVNAIGTVVGNAYTTANSIAGVRPFIWRDGVTTFLPIPEGSASGFATDINDSGIAVGYSSSPCNVCVEGRAGSALRWDDGVLTDLGRLGGHQGLAMTIDNQGRIAGGVVPGGGGWIENGAVVQVAPSVVVAASDAGYLVSRSGEDIHLWHDGEDHLIYAGHRVGVTVHGVDDAGQVIATLNTYNLSPPYPHEEIIRLPNDRIFGLNKILAPVTSWQLEAAMAMSEDGVIAGYGRETPESPVHAVVLKPRS